MPGTLTPILEEVQLVEQGAEPRELASTPRQPWRLDWLLLAIAAVFFALHYVHLRADFPNYSQWKDWAKYTDEGWYGDAAIRHYYLGTGMCRATLTRQRRYLSGPRWSLFSLNALA